MASDRELHHALKLGQLGSVPSINVSDTADALDERVIRLTLPSTAANTNVAASAQVYFSRAVRIKEVRFIPGGTLLRDTTNYGLINVDFNNSNGGTGTLLCQVNTHNSAQGNLAADTHIAPTINATARDLVAGSSLRVSLLAVAGVLAAAPKVEISVRFQEI
jgi:hypothetical protein